MPLVLRFAFALLLAAPLAAQPVTKDADPRVPLDSAVVSGRLPNGVRYLLRRNKLPENRVALRLVVDAGSVLEDADQRGLAHFVEHMAFNGTRRFEKSAIVDYLERSGVRFGPDLNASTSFDETIYMLDVPTDSARVVDTAVQILADWAGGIAFDSAEVVRERGVVLEEWRLGQGAQARIANAMRPVVLRGSRYAERLPIGDTTTIRSADAARLRRFYADWYRPDLMTVVAVGDVDPERLRTLIAREFGALKALPNARARAAYPVPPHAEPLVTVVTDREATNSVVSVLYKKDARPSGTVGAARQEIVDALADMMVNARLGELAQGANPPFLGAGAGGGRWVRGTEVYSVGAAVPEGGVERGLEAALSEVERVRRNGFTATELDRERRNLLRAIERNYAERDKTSNDVLVSRLVDYALNGDPLTSASYDWALAQRVLPSDTLAEVNRAIAARIDGASRVISVQAPERAGAALPTSAALLAVFDRVSRATLAAYADSASDAPLVARPPAPGRITAARTIASIGATEWTLSNGARVILKPTDFKADEVLVQAFSPGGTSVVADSDVVAASLATAIVQEGGAGTFNQIALQKRLAGTAVSVTPYIASQSQGISGRAAPRDLGTMFELAYLALTAPRADSTAYGALRGRIESFLVNRGRDPSSVFQDTILVTMAQHHPRSRPLTPASMSEIDLPRAMRIYRTRFANPGALTWVLVGAFNVDSVRPLVERWVAALPPAARTDSVRDDGQRPPTGALARTVRKGVEPQATTQIVFSGTMRYSRDERFALGVLEEVLTLRLRDRIREALGGTYGVQVSSSAQRLPVGRFQLAVGFGSAPERVEELATAVQREIDSLVANGPTADELQKVRETGIRELETATKQNRFWLGALVSAAQIGEPLDGVTAERALYDTITPALVQQAARTYLTTGNVARFTLLPETPPSR